MSDTTLLLKALHFAADQHRDQRRKGAEASPYINHPIAVAQALAEIGGVTDAATLAAAILHDTVEDTKTTHEQLVDLFGTTIAGIVAEVTDDMSLPSAERKRLQVEHGPHLSRAAKLVKLADKLCNVIDIIERPPDWPQWRKDEYLQWASALVSGLQGTNPALERCFDDAIKRMA